MSIGSFATPFRRIHQRHHRRNVSNNSSSSTPSSSSSPSPTSSSGESPSRAGMLEQAKSKYELQKIEAKEIWSKTECFIKNDWQWPNPPASRCVIDTSKEYVERTTTTSDDTIDDLTTAAATQRKRQVRAETLEEVTWNTGLKIFEERRKLWTGAVDLFLPPGNATDYETVKRMQEAPAEMLASIEKSKAELFDGLSDESSDESSIEVADTSVTRPDPSTSKLGTTLLPFYMPILPKTMSLTQPLSSPMAERVLYKNLVIDAKTAIAPIPLANVVRACVAGLKDADEWPPRVGTLDPLVGKVNKEKRKSRIRSLLGLSRDDDNMVLDAGVIAAQARFDTTSR